jgi:hypothetical protein
MSETTLRICWSLFCQAHLKSFVYRNMVTNVGIIYNLMEQLLDWTIHKNNMLYHFVVVFSRALLNHTLANSLSHSGAWSNQEWKGSELDAILAQQCATVLASWRTNKKLGQRKVFPRSWISCQILAIGNLHPSSDFSRFTSDMLSTSTVTLERIYGWLEGGVSSLIKFSTNSKH